jgi:error-prone DNA polymerase
MTYAELHTHSWFSFLDASSSPEQMAGRAHALGIKAMALTDVCGLYGIVPFYQECKLLGIKPIAGTVLELDNGDRVVLLAKNMDGYKNLSRLITKSRMNKEKGEHLCSIFDLCAHRHDLICLVGGKGSLLAELVFDPEIDKAKEMLSLYQSMFLKDSIYLELNFHLEPMDLRRCLIFKGLSDQMEIPLVACNAPKYHTEKRGRLLDILCCIKERCTLMDSERILPANHEQILKSPEEMTALFEQYPQAIENTLDIASRCHLEMDFSNYRFPDYEVPEPYDADSYLKKLCLEALPNKYEVVTKEVMNRFYEEYNLICKKKLSGYFLVVWDLVTYSNRLGVPVQGRGSAANSMVAYLLEVMPVDPIKHNLFFGRFLNEDTEVAPDIDLDFASTPGDDMPHREDVIKYVYEKYGSEHVAMACTFVTFQARNAIREIGKVMDIPEPILASMSKLCGGHGIEFAMHELSRVKEFQPWLNAPSWGHFCEMIVEIKNLPRHVSIHVGGMVISSVPLSELVPLEPARKEGRVVCQWDKDSIEDAGLVKVDILGLRMLSVLRDSREMLQKSGICQVDFSKLPQNDSKVYEMIGKADTVGLFQVESRAQMQSLPRTLPRNFEQLAIQVAIIRPGPLQGNMVNPYINRRQGKEEVDYPHPSLEPILKETLGVILFQEQVLKVAVTAAGFSAGQANQLRKAMSRKRSREAMAKLRQDFLLGCLQKGIKKEDADKIYSTLEGFALYGFCKSHALAFANIAYISAWLKLYYPAYFLCGLLNNQPMGFYSRSVLIREAQRKGISVLPVSINGSEVKCSVENNQIRLGLDAIKGLGFDKSLDIIQKRKNGFFSLPDFIRRTECSLRLIENMIQSGAFDCFGMERRELLWQLWLYRKQDERQLFDLLGKQSLPNLPKSKYWDLLDNEMEKMRMSPRTHPFRLLRQTLGQRGYLSSSQLKRVDDDIPLKVAGVVICRQKPPTAKGFAFLTLEDEFGMINLVIRPDVYDRDRVVFRRSGLVCVEGVRQKRHGVLNIKVERLIPLSLTA